MKAKRVAALSLLGVLALALTGCVQLKDQQGAQTDVIGPLHLTTTVCSSNGFGPQSATAPCAAANAGPERAQLLVAYLVPTTITPPATATMTTPSGPLTMSRDASYAAVVESGMPAGAGRQWVGYRSQAYDFGSESGGATRTVTADADFALPPAADGGPFAGGPVTYSVVVGEHHSPDASTDDEPVVCDSPVVPPGFLTAAQRKQVRAAYARGGTRAVRRWARAHGSRRVMRAAGIPVTGNSECDQGESGDKTVATRDLAVLPGGGATAQQGATATVPFNVKFAGPAGDDAVFALTVDGVPGASVASPLKPATDSTTAVPVTVEVPGDLAPGTYNVRLTARSGGQTRSGVAQLTVTAKPAETPLPALTETLDELPQTTLGQIQSSGQPATVGCNVDCTAIVDLLMYKPPADRVGITAAARYRAVPTVLLGRVRVPVAGGAKQSVTIPVRDNAKEKLGNLGRFTLVVRTTATDGRGQATPALVRKVRLKPGCGGRPSCVPRR